VISHCGIELLRETGDITSDQVAFAAC